MANKNILFSFLLFCSFLLACGGGGSSDSGMLFQGKLTQGSAAHHKLFLKHGAGEPIGNVTICALDGCTITDDAGEWGFVVESEFAGGPVEFSIDGHGISAKTIIEVDAGANQVDVEFVHQGNGVVSAEEVVIDGHNHASHDHGDEA